MPEKIKVCITCKQVVEYSQIVDVTPDQFELLKKHNGHDLGDDDDVEAYRLVDSLIDRREVFSADEEYKDFTVYKEAK